MSQAEPDQPDMQFLAGYLDDAADIYHLGVQATEERLGRRDYRSGNAEPPAPD